MARLPRAFYDRNSVHVARDLIGRRLVRLLEGQRLSGLIVETEAYRGPLDQASHAFRLTPRSAIMYGPPGFAYVYVIYGRNHCLNAVTEAAGEAGAVLIRAIVPEEGLELMWARRGLTERPRPGAALRRLTDGPGKVCQALGIDLSLKGTDLTTSDVLYIEEWPAAPEEQISKTPRIGVRGDEETRLRPWRFLWRK